MEDIRKDEKLLNANVIHLLETSLSADAQTGNLGIDGYEAKFTNVANGKGIVTFVQEDATYNHEKEEIHSTLQVTKLNIKGISSISLYRSSNHSIVEAAKSLRSVINTREATLITGDFNVCTVKDQGNSLTKMLEELGFIQLVSEATHIQGGHIDHCYWLDNKGKWKLPVLERYSPYHSDHDALLITLKTKK